MVIAVLLINTIYPSSLVSFGSIFLRRAATADTHSPSSFFTLALRSHSSLYLPYKNTRNVTQHCTLYKIMVHPGLLTESSENLLLISSVSATAILISPIFLSNFVSLAFKFVMTSRKFLTVKRSAGPGRQYQQPPPVKKKRSNGVDESTFVSDNKCLHHEQSEL